MYNATIDWISDDAGMISLVGDWYGIHRVAVYAGLDGLKPGQNVVVSISGGRKRPIVQTITARG